jgi:dUTP pyrophosphatase
MIKTGISMAIPDGYVGLIWPRSGLAVKHGLDTMAGVVDSGYRGEVCVVLQNHGYEPYNVKAGDRIAQILFQSILSVQMIETEELNNSDRGQSGFGSSGN